MKLVKHYKKNHGYSLSKLVYINNPKINQSYLRIIYKKFVGKFLVGNNYIWIF